MCISALETSSGSFHGFSFLKHSHYFQEGSFLVSSSSLFPYLGIVPLPSAKEFGRIYSKHRYSNFAIFSNFIHVLEKKKEINMHIYTSFLYYTGTERDILVKS